MPRQITNNVKQVFICRKTGQFITWYQLRTESKNMRINCIVDLYCLQFDFMMFGKGKKIVPYELYEAKKSRQVDHLCQVVQNVKKIEAKTQIQLDSQSKLQKIIRKKMIEKRVNNILHNYQQTTVSEPNSYIKRTWISPLQKSIKDSDQMIPNFKLRKKKEFDQHFEEKSKVVKICNILNLNKKMHLFGQFMYCDFDGKQNTPIFNLKNKESQIEALHKKYKKMINYDKQKLLVCNNNSTLSKKIFHNPLKNDNYFQKIIRKNEQLVKILIKMLSVNGTFTFSSYIEFYNIFVWQQAQKNEQINFVCKLLMGEQTIRSYQQISEKIDYFCSKINIRTQNDSLTGFNEVMKKLLFGKQYENMKQEDKYMTKQDLQMSLDINQECISIFINVFYSQ